MIESYALVSIIDAVIVTTIVAPLFFMFVYIPMTRRIKKLDDFHFEMVQFQIRQEIFQSVFQETSEAVIITNGDGKIVKVNPAATELTGFSKEELIGSKPSILSSGQHSKEFYENMWTSIEKEGHWQDEIWNRKKSGELYAQRASISKIPSRVSGSTTNYVSVFHDITNRKQQEDDLTRRANHDPLTGLPNRAVFEDRLEQVLTNNRRNQQKAGVLFLDLDKFKPVNDTYGHAVGDKLLIEISKRIQEIIRKEDTLARVGGDEFTIIFRSIAKAKDAGILAQKIIDVVSMPFEIDGNSVQVGVSIGIAIYPSNADTMEGLLLRADAAMYAAKNDGRNNYKYYKE